MQARMDPMHNKLNQLKTVPLVYDECLARLELDGLSDMKPRNESESRRLNSVLDFFCDKLCMEKLFIF